MQLNVYPNPTTDVINIKVAGELEAISVTMVNMQGQTIIQQAVSDQTMQIVVSHLPAANYWVVLRKEETILSRHLISITH